MLWVDTYPAADQMATTNLSSVTVLCASVWIDMERKLQGVENLHIVLQTVLNLVSLFCFLFFLLKNHKESCIITLYNNLKTPRLHVTK